MQALEGYSGKVTFARSIGTIERCCTPQPPLFDRFARRILDDGVTILETV